MRAALVFALAFLVGCAAVEETSAGTSAITVENGETQPIYRYADAVRESIFVEAPIDSDGDGKPDRIALDIVRPNASGVKVATLMVASPYWQAPATPAFALPLGHQHWHDQFFVERGYAAVEVEMQGTARSTGCPKSGGKEDTASIKAAIDWLNGRARGFDASGREAFATWSTGNVGMVGMSYEGTLPIAVATAGVPGLKTIVPISAISSWYDYTRDYGIGYVGWDNRYVQGLADFVLTDAQRPKCGAVLSELGDDSADDTFDMTPFWEERDYRRNLDKVTASVLVIHGLRDTNVKLRNFERFWDGLAQRNIPRKLWLHKEGHTDPLRIRSAEWKVLLHRWMDHWLYDVDNGVMTEPRVDIQRGETVWETHADWPEGQAQTFFPAMDATLGAKASSGEQSFTDDPTKREYEMVQTPEVEQTYRRAWLGAPLANAVRISGTPHVAVRARTDTTSTPLSVMLVDYGVTTSAEPENLTFDQMFGRAAIPPRAAPVTTLQQIVSRGSIDVKNRVSLAASGTLVPGTSYDVEWDLQPADYVFVAGHRIGLVISANNSTYVTVDPLARDVTLSLENTKIVLPVVF